eukprot:TRINITY_DN81901_c0_g1_i1.p1 TRINITY_DN81901_c0_g1~~TRINITY_DN81901_c0_g1_i1.p1  ORF type:complete len:280 (+),score=38.94 TRINITY_DN81901_c0_g1_i1:42-842(+)
MGASFGCDAVAAPRTDRPAQGGEFEFSIKSDGMFSKDFTVFDGSKGEPMAPWLVLDHGGKDFIREGGKVRIAMKEGDGESLMELDITAPNFKQLDTKNDAKPNWFLQCMDFNTALVWSITRELRGPGFQLKCTYQGVAEASDDNDSDGEGEESDAICKSLTFELSVNGRPVQIKHSMTGVLNGTDREQEYELPGLGFTADLKEVGWGRETVGINVAPQADPILAVGLGFMLAYWLHPEKAESLAEERALNMLRTQTGNASYYLMGA